MNRRNQICLKCSNVLITLTLSGWGYLYKVFTVFCVILQELLSRSLDSWLEITDETLLLNICLFHLMRGTLSCPRVCEESWRTYSGDKLQGGGLLTLAKCRLGVGDGRVLCSHSYISATQMGNISFLLKLVSASLLMISHRHVEEEREGLSCL